MTYTLKFSKARDVKDGTAVPLSLGWTPDVDGGAVVLLVGNEDDPLVRDLVLPPAEARDLANRLLKYAAHGGERRMICRACGCADASVELPPVRAVADGGRYADLDEARLLERLDPVPPDAPAPPGICLCAPCADRFGWTP